MLISFRLTASRIISSPRPSLLAGLITCMVLSSHVCEATPNTVSQRADFIETKKNLDSMNLRLECASSAVSWAPSVKGYIEKYKNLLESIESAPTHDEALKLVKGAAEEAFKDKGLVEAADVSGPHNRKVRLDAVYAISMFGDFAASFGTEEQDSLMTYVAATKCPFSKIR